MQPPTRYLYLGTLLDFAIRHHSGVDYVALDASLSRCYNVGSFGPLTPNCERVMNTPSLLLTLLVSGVILTSTPAAATTLVTAGVPQLIDRASVVVEGRVVSVNTILIDASPHIFTDFTFEVSRTLLGPHRDTITVRVPGGTHLKRSVVVEGMPSLPRNHDLLLILEVLPKSAWSSPEPHYLPLGLQQGVFSLSSDLSSFSRDLFHPSKPLLPACFGGESVTAFNAASLRRFISETAYNVDMAEGINP